MTPSGDAAARPRVLTVERDQPDPAVLEEAALVLRAGGLVVFPTETLYGIGADPWNHAAVARVIATKGRPETKGMPVLIGDLAAVDDLASDFPEAARRLAARFWPGPLTLVLPAREGLPAGVAPDGVAVRWTSCRLAALLAAAAGGAVVATSANRSGDPVPPLDARRILETIGAGIDLLLDAGPLPDSLASTLVDARTDPPTVLRRGAIDPEDGLRASPPRRD